MMLTGGIEEAEGKSYLRTTGVLAGCSGELTSGDGADSAAGFLAIGSDLGSDPFQPAA